MKRWPILFVTFILLLLGLSSGAFAEVLTLNLNQAEFTEGESARLFGYLFDDNLVPKPNNVTSVYLDGVLINTSTTDSEGYYEEFITNLTAGEHNLSVNTSESSKVLPFTVYSTAQAPSYKILASSLTVPLAKPVLNLTIQKYINNSLVNQSLGLNIYYQNGSLYQTTTAISGLKKALTFPAEVGLYTVTIDNKRNFVVAVVRFDLRFKITNKAGEQRDVFNPNEVVYFEVQGFSNGQAIENATVFAKVTTPLGDIRTIALLEHEGSYTGNTNSTVSGSPIILAEGEYEVEFTMKDSSNNQQMIKGFFRVNGLSVGVNLRKQVAYSEGQTATFDISVKNLEDGTLINHSNVAYRLEIEKNGKLYDSTFITPMPSQDPAYTSVISFNIPKGFDDGDYLLRVRATYNGMIGKGKESFSVRNTNFFVKLSDNYGWPREFFQPGELAKAVAKSDKNITFLKVSVYDNQGNLLSTQNASSNSEEMELSFNAPATEGNYLSRIEGIVNGKTITREIWFDVQNYFSFLDVKNLKNEQQYIIQRNKEFLVDIKVFDVSKGQGVDISNFIVKFDKVVNEESQVEYTNLNATENQTYSNRGIGEVVYNIRGLDIPNGPYRIEYTLVGPNGKSLKGKGWFGVSAFNVWVGTYTETGQNRVVFSPGETVNVSVDIGEGNGTATIHRPFFPPKEFNITNGRGSTLLRSSSNELPSEPGGYPFGVEITLDTGDTGLGDGYFEVRSLNFRNINPRNNGEFSTGENILVDVVVEKSGEVVNGSDVFLERLVSAYDGREIPASAVAIPTDSHGRTHLNITPDQPLAPGDYFADISGTYENDTVWGGFGFKVVGDSVSITVDSDDKSFSQTESIPINVKVRDSNGVPKGGVTVRLVGLMNLDTWGPLPVSKSAENTSSNGMASFSISAQNYNPNRYAPIVNVSGSTIIGFGDGEFEIKPFDYEVGFAGDASFSPGEDILVNVDVVGNPTITAAVKGMDGTTQPVDYFYDNGVLTVHNELAPGEYFLEVTITSGTKSKTTKLWFEVKAPTAHFLTPKSLYASGDTLNFNYTVFTIGLNGWEASQATINLLQIEDMWTGEAVPVGENFTADGKGSHSLDLAQFGLPPGDYLLRIRILENPEFDGIIYFRISNDVTFNATANVDGNNVTINVSANSGGSLGSYNYTLVRYSNFETFNETLVGLTNGNGSFLLTNLPNGFYQAQMKITAGSEIYYMDVHFEVRVREVDIAAPATANQGDTVDFNITSSTNTLFWIIDAFTHTVMLKQPISPGNQVISYTFNEPGKFIYGYGDDKWRAFQNKEEINILQLGFQVAWPSRWTYIVGESLHFNVSTPMNNTNLTLWITSHFTGGVKSYSLGKTPQLPNEWKQFSIPIDVLGPQDLKLVLDAPGEPPRSDYFIDTYPDQYEMAVWADNWEYKSGDTITLKMDIHDILTDQHIVPDSVLAVKIENPTGTNMGGFNWNNGDNYATISTDETWVTGQYHVMLNLTKGSVTRTLWVDFFVRGNDNLQLYSFQNKWDVGNTDILEVTVDAQDNGAPAAGVKATLDGLDLRPESWDKQPTPVAPNPGSFYFSTPNNSTNAQGRIVFFINMSSSGLASGGYDGRLNVGGQILWFNFNLRKYKVDAYTNDWDYGINDTIELNVRARDIGSVATLPENGNVTIQEIRVHDPEAWKPSLVNLAALGLESNRTEMVNGEALIEMQANNTALQLDKPKEFEVWLRVELPSGVEDGWASFKLRNTKKPSLTIVDATGTAPTTFFGGQGYTLKLSGRNLSATLNDIWGPEHIHYGAPFVNVNGTLQVNFTSPRFPGIYEIEVEMFKAGEPSEFLHRQFQIGSGSQLDCWMDGNVVLGVNSSIEMHLFGQGKDPFCNGPGCDQNMWFGPLTNKTIMLVGMKDLSNFSYTNLTALNLTTTTGGWPSWMQKQQLMTDCGAIANEDDCNKEKECGWAFNSEAQNEECMDLHEFCRFAGYDKTNCDKLKNKSCEWDQPTSECVYNDMKGIEEPGEEEVMPGDSVFTFNPALLGLAVGEKYDLIFSYNGNTTCKVFAQVENFHVAISKKESNLATNSEQRVWVKTTDLGGNPKPGCTINFTGIYNDKDFSLVRSLSIHNQTDSNGELIFSYVTPSLPGEYIVEGEAICNVSGALSRQNIAYHIDVGARNLKVDMKTKYDSGENIRIAFTTLNRLGEPKPEWLNIELYHTRDNYAFPVYPEMGEDCTYLEAGPEGRPGSGANNFLSIQTDESGQYELELCPLPEGIYDIRVSPAFNEGFNEGPNKDDFGYFSSFLVSTIDVNIKNKLKYVVGDNVSLNISATDEFGQPVNGSIIALSAEVEVPGTNRGMIINEYNGSGLQLNNGKQAYSFTIPSTIDENNKTVNLTLGPVFVMMLIQDSSGKSHYYESMQFALVKSHESSIIADPVVGTGKLINVSVQTDNLASYKVQVGAFFMRDNPESDKKWMIENGVFLVNASGKSSTGFKILTPNEPGRYYLGIPILPLGFSLSSTRDPLSKATELLITPIEVKLETVNVTGRVVNLADQPVENALVKIGKAEEFTDADGYFSLEIPKGKKSLVVEKKYGQLKQFMKTRRIGFDSDKVVNITLYGLGLSGELQVKLFNITNPGFDLSTTKLRINVTVNNTGSEQLSNFSLRGIAMSGKESLSSGVAAHNTTHLFLSRLYAGFENGKYKLKIWVLDDNWNSSGYILVNNTGVNSTVGAVLTKDYTVETYVTAGNGLDDDSDGLVDEEEDNNKDDDGDGLIDEDLKGETYVEWCGNGFCSAEEFQAGNCWEDCAKGSVCGDGTCDPDEKYNCPADCNETGDTCETPNQCNEDGTFCNSWGLKEPAAWCEIQCDEDNCWACSVNGTLGNTECEKKGCEVDSDGTGNKWCYKPVECSADDCWACQNETSCTATGICHWRQDNYGGWCERPWVCSVECGACSNQSSCENSPALMKNTSCRWVADPQYGGWCEWNFSNLPPKAGSAGIIGNVWLSLSNDTEDFQSVADNKCFSGNCGSGLEPGDYYIFVDFGTTDVNLSVNNTVVQKFVNFNGWWRTFVTSAPYHFTNGSYIIEIRDLIGPDLLDWQINFGQEINLTPNSVCGNGIVESGEDCDGNNLTGKDCNSPDFGGSFDGGTLSCDAGCHFNVSGCNQVQGFSLSGQVNGSVIDNATVLLLNHTSLGVVKSVSTNSNGVYNFTGLEPGTYDFQVYMPPSHPEYKGLVITVENLTLNGGGVMDIFVPHIFVIPMVNNIIPNGTPSNFTLLVNNSENFAVNASVFLNASIVGDNGNFNMTNPVAPNNGLNFVYEFTPTVVGMNDLSFSVMFELPFLKVVAGLNPPGVVLDVDILDFHLPVNVTIGQCQYANSTQCQAAPGCGWSDPPGSDPPLCLACSELTASGSDACNASLGCHWSGSECVGDVQ